MRYVIVLLAVAGIFISSRALQVHMQDPTAAPPCAVEGHWDCGAVNHSRFATFPPSTFDEPANSHKLHIPVATLGIVGYALIGLFALFNQFRLAFGAAVIGFFFAANLTYLEAYVIEKWCIYCVWSQAIITATLLATIAALVLENRRKKRFSASAVIAS